jgi:hypothetical protein
MVVNNIIALRLCVRKQLLAKTPGRKGKMMNLSAASQGAR